MTEDYEHESFATGYSKVESSVSCLVTRFELKSFFSLIRFYFYYRNVRKESQNISGLIRSSFLIENLTTCMTFSIWEDTNSILEFNGKITSHIVAANAAMSEVKSNEQGIIIWSAQFRLSATSPHNLNWPRARKTSMGNTEYFY